VRELNPYSTTNLPATGPTFFGDHATRKAGSFLYRVIEIRHPEPIELVYSGWWFRQTVDLDGLRVWTCISWLSIRPRLEFAVPDAISRAIDRGRIEIDFARGLRIRRFRLWLDDLLVYDEVV
jgi:hypothetical protein